jgi:hypothetical protein
MPLEQGAWLSPKQKPKGYDYPTHQGTPLARSQSPHARNKKDSNNGIQQKTAPTYIPNRLNTASGIARTAAMITRQIPGV